MSKKYREKIYHRKMYLFPKIKKGDFGKVKITSILTNLMFRGQKAYLHKIDRFSNDEILIAEIDTTFTVDGTHEMIDFTPKIINEYHTYLKNTVGSKPIYMNVNFCFYNLWGVYRLVGYVGSYGINIDIGLSTYKLAKSKIIEMCNPNHEYCLNEILEILQLDSSPEITTFFEHWNEFIEEPKKRKCKLPTKNNYYSF